MSAETRETAEDSLPDTILNHLLAAAGNERRRTTLGHLKEACDDLVRGRQALTFAAIQFRVEHLYGSEAGPKAQSLSNEKGRTPSMYAYVMARQREQAAARRPPARRGGVRVPIDDVIDNIDDMDIQSRMRDLADRLDVMQRENARARALFKALRPGGDFDQFLSRCRGHEGEPAQQTLAEPMSGAPVPAHHVAALEHVVHLLQDCRHLATVGLTFDGSRVKRNGGTGDTLIEGADMRGINNLLADLTRTSEGSAQHGSPSLAADTVAPPSPAVDAGIHGTKQMG